jgi:hypothetical protein
MTLLGHREAKSNVLVPSAKILIEAQDWLHKLLHASFWGQNTDW